MNKKQIGLIGVAAVATVAVVGGIICISSKSGSQEWSEKVSMRGIVDEDDVAHVALSNGKIVTVDDAMELVGDPNHKKEIAYADYANNLKSLANQARKESVAASKDIGFDKEAAKQYQIEVQSIKDKIIEAKKSAPRERMAQRQAAYVRYCKINEYGGEVSKDQYKKITNQALAEARSKYNSKRYDIKLTPKEWEAISHNAVQKTLVRELLSSMNKDNLLELAMPKSTTTVSPSKRARAKAMAKNGYTLDEIATALNISVSSVSNVVNN